MMIWYENEPARIDSQGYIHISDAKGGSHNTGEKLEEIVGNGGYPLYHRHTRFPEIDDLF